MWLWRDWVIDAFNRNMPYDQFLVEQLAGDLLPEPTEAQLIATGFQRNNMVTHEGGTIPEENLTNYNVDRVKTLGEAVLGLTLGCAQCHDHKYDPITQRDYYQLFAYFNTLSDIGLDGNAGVNPRPMFEARTVLHDGRGAGAAASGLRRSRASWRIPTRRRSQRGRTSSAATCSVAAKDLALHPAGAAQGEHAESRGRVSTSKTGRFVRITAAAGPGGVRRLAAAAADRASRSRDCASCFIPMPALRRAAGGASARCRMRRKDEADDRGRRKGTFVLTVVFGQRRRGSGRPGEPAIGCSPCGA